MYGRKRIILSLVVAALMISIAGAGALSVAPKTEASDGVTVALTTSPPNIYSGVVPNGTTVYLYQGAKPTATATLVLAGGSDVNWYHKEIDLGNNVKISESGTRGNTLLIPLWNDVEGARPWKVEVSAHSGGSQFLWQGTLVIVPKPTKASVLTDINALTATVNRLSCSAFLPGTKLAVLTVINAAKMKVNAGSYGGAVTTLKVSLLARTDGCAKQGKPDSDDWVRTCAAQGALYPQVQYLIIELQLLQQHPAA